MVAGIWARFEYDIAAWVKTFARPHVQFCAGRTSIPGFPTSGFRAEHELQAVTIKVCCDHMSSLVPSKAWPARLP